MQVLFIIRFYWTVWINYESVRMIVGCVYFSIIYRHSCDSCLLHPFPVAGHFTFHLWICAYITFATWIDRHFFHFVRINKLALWIKITCKFSAVLTHFHFINFRLNFKKVGLFSIFWKLCLGLSQVIQVLLHLSSWKLAIANIILDII